MAISSVEHDISQVSAANKWDVMFNTSQSYIEDHWIVENVLKVMSEVYNSIPILCTVSMIYHTVRFNTTYPHKNNLCCGRISVWVEGITSLGLYILCAIDLIHPYMIIVAVKLLSILMNLGKIVLQVGCSDKII
jgi:hypothetical protein